ncbi:MAG: DUF3843 family protein [Bacteroidetes bacterium]|nr:DUF3843 family protein [Bacteroidota bacterium]
MIKKIYIDDWLVLKPYDILSTTDSYYLKLSNEVKKNILNDKHAQKLHSYIDDKEINILSCFLTCYFEDIISGTNIWNSFVRIHKRLYKKPLPFFGGDNYCEEEINSQDISFLIWYFLNTIQDEKFILPFQEFLIEMGDAVLEVFENEWEYAPENTRLISFFQLDETADFYDARTYMEKILFKSYLFNFDTADDLVSSEIETIENYIDDKNISTFLTEGRDFKTHTSHTRILSLLGKEWAAEILGTQNPLSKSFLNMSPRVIGYFLYKGQDHTDIFIEHIASGKKFELTKKSFDHHKLLVEIDTIMRMGIVKWMDEWWFSGVYVQTPFDADLVLDEKNSLTSRQAVNFLDHQKMNINDILQGQLDAFLEFNNGSQIAFIPCNQIDNFVDGYMKYYNAKLELSAKEILETEERTRRDGFFGFEEEPSIFSTSTNTGLVFFNPKSGCEIALEINSAFPLDNNPYCEKELSAQHVLHLLMNENFSTELVMFWLQNCENDLSYFKTDTGKKYFDDLDFLLRFWKKSNYHSKPLITITGQDQG